MVSTNLQTFWTIAVCVIATTINVYVFHAMDSPKVITFRDVAKMRRPNQFVGLEHVASLGPAEPVTIYPNLLSRINRADPDRAYGDDPVKFASWGGFVAPEDRQFQVDSKFSTIVEFQAVDYKMENCQLQLIVPSTNSNSNSSSVITSSESSQTIIELWVLDHPGYRLDIGTLSWNTRPPRKHLIDSIVFPLHSNYMYTFHCPLNSIHAFEFSAGTDSSSVEWSQDYDSPNPAVRMVQHASD